MTFTPRIMNLTLPLRCARWLVLAGALTTLAACAFFTPPEERAQALLGGSEVQVAAAWGQPPEAYKLAGGGVRWLYPTQPFGQQTYAAEFDASGKLISFKQVLRTLEFARAKVGEWTKKDILENFGSPVETAYFPLMKREVWSYRFKHEDVWPSLYHFYFDPEGVVRLTQVSPDPLYEAKDRDGK
jgi:hypothetical protein